MSSSLGIVGLGVALVWASATAVGAETNATADTAVRLPPLLVESSTGQPWLYCKVDGFEILSRCSRTTTEQLVRTFVGANEGLNRLLPDRFRLRMDEPQPLLFYDAALWPKARQEALAQMLLARAPLPGDSQLVKIETTTVIEPAKSTSPEKSARENTVSDRVFHFNTAELTHVRRNDRTRVRGYVLNGTLASESPTRSGAPDFFNNIRLSDSDIMGTFAIVSGQELDDSHSAITYEAVAQVVNGRVPKLPGWFITGFLSLYAHIRFDAGELVAPKLNSSAVSELERSLIPIRELLYDKNAAARNPNRWVAQAELFVRWGLDPEQKHDQAFWRFVERTSVESENEPAFAECFGLSIEEASNDLRRYLSVAKRANISWPRQKQADRPIELRDATRSEIARIRGEWERLETRYVRVQLPDEEPVYLAQARRTVASAYARGDRDPRLVTTFALLQLDAGDASAAQPLLEEAAALLSVRPRVYFELAKMRYEEALNRTHRNDGKIEGSDLGGIVDPLAFAATKSPPLLGVYELLADVWANAASEPKEAQLSVIERGLALFAAEPELHYRAAKLYRKLGDSARADSLAKAALNDAQPQLAAEIREFREQLAVAAKK